MLIFRGVVLIYCERLLAVFLDNFVSFFFWYFLFSRGGIFSLGISLKHLITISLQIWSEVGPCFKWNGAPKAWMFYAVKIGIGTMDHSEKVESGANRVLHGQGQEGVTCTWNLVKQPFCNWMFGETTIKNLVVLEFQVCNITIIFLQRFCTTLKDHGEQWKNGRTFLVV